MRRRLVSAAVLVALAGAVAVLGWQLRSDRAAAAGELERRFGERVHQAADYVAVHLGDLADRQRTYALGVLDDEAVDADDFDAAALAFGFQAGLLLDGSGRVLAVSPQRDELLGAEIASGYDHLADAVAGRSAVSDVVRSAAQQVPIIAVAVPYDSPQGRRVISGGYALPSTVLDRFLTSASTLRGRAFALVDGEGVVVASTEEVVPPVPADGGRVRHDGRTYLTYAAPVAGSSWRLEAAVPEAELLAPVADRSHLPDALLAVAVLLVLAVCTLLARLLRQRDLLEQTSRTDPVTGLLNRRAAEDVLVRVAAATARARRPWAVAVIDVDRFKQVNDRLGHAAGDDVLRDVAGVLRFHVRRGDHVARWGGEEFVVVMDGADTIEAVQAAERLAAAVRRGVVVDDEPLTVSIGVASGTAVQPGDLLVQADEAMYRAKSDGRDRVELAVPSTIAGLV